MWYAYTLVGLGEMRCPQGKREQENEIQGVMLLGRVYIILDGLLGAERESIRNISGEPSSGLRRNGIM